MFDFVIYGASLEGLLVAQYLQNKGLNVLVLEPSAKVGDIFAPVCFRETCVVNLFSTLMQKEMASLPRPFETQNISLMPLTFEKGHLEPFVGFGESAPQYVEYLSPWTQGQTLDLDPSLCSFLKAIPESGLAIRFQTTITSLTISSEKISEVIINDKEKILAKNFIFTLHPNQILDLLQGHAHSSKIFTQLSKTQSWAAIQLSLVHAKPVTDNDQIHILYGTQKNPVISLGRFKNTTSQWMSFLPSDEQDIHEQGVVALKEMKRQIRRAYPNAFDQISFEKISLLGQIFGHIDLKTKTPWQIDGLKNLLLCSRSLIASPSPIMNSFHAYQNAIDILEKAFLQEAESQTEAQNNEINAAP